MPFSFGLGNKSVFSKGNKSDIVTDNLVFRIDASRTTSYPGSGTTVNDISGQGNTSTLTNGVGFSNGEFSFDVTNKTINIPHTSSLSLGQTFTVGAWVRATTLGSVLNDNAIGSRQIIFSNRINNTAGCWQLELNGNTVSVTGVGTFVISAGTLIPNAWYYITYVRDGSGSGTIYINGVAQSPSVTNAYTFIDNTDTKQIGGGGSTGTGQPFNGKIRQLHLYKKALTQTEVLQNYYATSGIVTQNLALHLDGAAYSGSGTTWNDLSGANRTTTLQPGMTYSSDGGGSIVFTPTTYATVGGNSSFFAGTAYTKSVWVKFTSLANYKNLISSANNNAHAFWVPENFSGVSNKLCTGHNGQWTTTAGATTIEANVWYNFTMTYSPTNGMKVYINGVLDGSNAAATATFGPTDSPCYIGSYGLLGNGFDGRMSTAMIYTKELSAAEVLQNYNATSSRYFPQSISGLQVWFKSDAGVLDASNNSITANNTAVATWQDQSGNGYHATQVTAGSRPVYKDVSNGQNNLPGVYFDGNNKWLQRTQRLFTSAVSYFVVCKWDDTTGRYWPFDAAGYYPYHFALEQHNNLNRIGFFGGENSWVTSMAPTAGTQLFSITANMVAGQTININTDVTFRRNRTTLSLTTNGQNGQTWRNYSDANAVGFDIGRPRTLSALGMKGQVFEIIVYNRVLTTTERNAVEDYLARKWNIS
jgi:hypothetical protein